MIKQYCLALALDLKDDPQLRDEYIKLHKHVWPEIKESIKEAGVLDMKIFNYRERLFMVMKVDERFSFEKKAAMDALNPKVQEWEKLMWKYQKQLPGANPDEKWVLMEEIFSLGEDEPNLYLGPSIF